MFVIRKIKQGKWEIQSPGRIVFARSKSDALRFTGSVLPMVSVTYMMHSNGRTHRYQTLAEAKSAANSVFIRTGIVMGIEKEEWVL